MPCYQRVVNLWRRFFELLFAFRLLSYGLDIYCKVPRFVLFIFYVFIPVSFIGLLFDRLVEADHNLSDSVVSCIDLAMLLNEFISITIWILIYRNIFLYKDFFRQMLQSTRLDLRLICMNTLFVVIYAIGLTGGLFYMNGPKDKWRFIAKLLAFHIWMSFFMFLGVYMQLAAVLKKQLAILLEQVVSTCANGTDIDELVKCRWTIRDATRTLNDACGFLILLFYLKSFTLMILYAGRLIYSSLVPSAIALTIVNAAYFLQMHYTAAEASEVEYFCDLIDRTVYRSLPGRLNHLQLNELRETLRFRHNWDSLKMSGEIVINTCTFYQFLATSVTCIAIILQFDSKVMYSLTKASEYLKTIDASYED